MSAGEFYYDNSRMKRLRRFAPFLALCALAAFCACSHWSSAGINLTPPKKLTLAVLPVEFVVHISKRKEIENPQNKFAPLDAASKKNLVGARVENIRRDMTDFLEKRISRSYFFDILPASGTALPAIFGVSISSSIWRPLGESLGADVFLRVQVEGYGHIKPSWLMYLLGIGAIEGLVQGVAASFILNSHQQWIAVGIGGEEMASETVEWLGGSYIFSYFFTPVILKGELINAKTGKVFWKETVMGTRDASDLKKMPKIERAKKEVRLRVVAQAALKELVRDIEKAAAKNEAWK
jgi:hypothetical protein